MSTRKRMQAIESIHRKYDFRWEVLDVIMGGRSLLDSEFGLTGFPMHSSEDAERFIASYGYDVNDPIESAEIRGNFHESLNFIRKFFLQPENPEGLKLEIPRKILELQNISDLFLWASTQYGPDTPPEETRLKDWACGVLKVMHTIAHIDKDVRSIYFSDIQTQIFDRFYKFIHRDGEGGLFLGESTEDPLRVELAEFETKPKKSRESVLLKLLHKPESVAEDIFDRVGVRFVTRDIISAMRVVKFLKDSMIVMPANIKPSRSRNTLLAVEVFRNRLEGLLAKVDEGELDEAGLLAELEAATRPMTADTDNPHSSEYYRSIQFTSRQLIKLRDPNYNAIRDLKALSKKNEASEEIGKVLDQIDPKYMQREIRFFFPYEVQICDEESHRENERGQSSHSEYKRAQIRTAMKRVMGRLADVTQD